MGRGRGGEEGGGIVFWFFFLNGVEVLYQRDVFLWEVCLSSLFIDLRRRFLFALFTSQAFIPIAIFVFLTFVTGFFALEGLLGEGVS